MSSRFVLPIQTALDANAAPLAGAKLYFYATGTSTPKDSYSDSALTTPNSNPVVADSAGRFGDIFLSGSYKVVLKDSGGVEVWSKDPVTGADGGLREDLASNTDAAKGSALVGYKHPGTGAVARTLYAKAQEVVSVKDFGAVGDGVADDTLAIQAALDAHSHVLVPHGTYMIDATRVSGTGYKYGLSANSNQTITLAQGATLKAIANSSGNYAVLSIFDKTNVTVSGGKVLGERADHGDTTGEHGMGIDIRGSQDVTLFNITVSDCWGDGVYIGAGPAAGAICANVVLDNINTTNCRRNGLSIVHAEYVRISNGRFDRTNGTDPRMGIDIEPNPGGHVYYVAVVNCEFVLNERAGLRVEGTNGTVKQVAIVNCSFNFNNTTAQADQAGLIFKDSAYAAATNCTFEGNATCDLRFERFKRGKAIGCDFLNSADDAVKFVDSEHNILSASTFSEVGKQGIALSGSLRNKITDNIFVSIGRDADLTYDGVNLVSSSNFNRITDNDFVLAASGNRIRYCVNIADSTCTDNTLRENYWRGQGGTDEYQDLGTSTAVIDNQGINRLRTFADGDTTPSVKDHHLFQTSNTAATSITQFDDGVIGQRITVRLDKDTTIVNSTDLRLEGGVDRVAASTNELIELLNVSGTVWLEIP